MFRKRIAVIVGCLSLLAAGGCSGTTPTSPGAGGALTVALPDDPASLDPATSSAAVERHILFQLYDCLIVVDDEWQPQPGGLTESFEASEDGLSYTFNLRQGIKFHNGEQFDANAVKDHFDRLQDPEVGSPYWEDFHNLGLVDVEVIDEWTVRFGLSRPSPFFLAVLADPAGGGIAAPEAAREAGKDFGTQPVGTGPFKLESWQRGDAIKLVRNEAYWKQAPRAESLTFRGHADSNSALTQFLAGQIDVIAQLSPQGLSQVESGGHQVITEPGIGTLRVFFNSTRPPFDNALVRQAVSAALDRETIRKTVMGDAAVTAGQPLAPIGLYEQAVLPVPPRDVAKAKDLLAAAGMPNGFDFTLLAYANNQDQSRAAQLIASQLEEVGIKIEIEPVQLSALLQRISSSGGHNYDATLLGGGAGNPDPVPWLYTNLGQHGSSQFGAASTDAMEQNFQTALTTLEVAERIEALKVVNAEVEDTASQTTLWFYNSLAAAKTHVKGLALTPTGILDLHEVTG